MVYEDGKPPHISLRIQELYDVNQTPKIAMGRVPVTVHILTPGMKPIQVTQDLPISGANIIRGSNPSCSANIRNIFGGETILAAKDGETHFAEAGRPTSWLNFSAASGFTHFTREIKFIRAGLSGFTLNRFLSACTTLA